MNWWAGYAFRVPDALQRATLLRRAGTTVSFIAVERWAAQQCTTSWRTASGAREQCYSHSS
ncbi:hypothetical protein S23_03840 [Bradyrhizobium cosmicum]|uniref:Uncharacterized protein n=1 Tax=Bradyrhizobium cosmicum TaxID=1404864 RepID=A0AAI8M852_9BRAD|nr:hypothetical protein S23_03840 [Bradyrhizobium cosmicum]